MVPSDALPSDYLRSISDVTLSCSLFQIYLGLKRNPREYGFTASTTFFDSTSDISERYTTLMNAKTPESRAETSFLFTNYADEDLALSPEGAVTVNIAEGMMMDDWNTLSPEEYKKKKEQTTEIILQKFEKVTGIPVKELVEVIISATPRTLHYYSGAPQGAFVGAAYTPDQILSKRTQPETPIKNLFLSGSFVGIGGVLGSLDSGISTGNLVLKAV
jgi:prolycopene isomerase